MSDTVLAMTPYSLHLDAHHTAEVLAAFKALPVQGVKHVQLALVLQPDGTSLTHAVVVVEEKP